MYTHQQITEELKSLGSSQKAQELSRFFKNGAGQYGEGDVFLGLTMLQQRALVKKYRGQVDFADLDELIASRYHECRMTALLIAVAGFERARQEELQQRYVSWYLSQTDQVNNWDLVDVTAPKLLGPWFYTHDRSPLYTLAAADHLWENRIAILTTFYFIRNDDYTDTLAISDILLQHPHDLIHKAVGWMLREIGKRDGKVERAFLAQRYDRMPRTMLRYAIEKFPEAERQRYLHGSI